MKTLLIAGTDTDVGKTIITTALRAYYQEYYSDLNISLMKLMQTGKQGDGEFYQRFFDDVVIPLRFDTPVAPPIAADLEGKSIDLGVIWQNLLKLQESQDIVLIEALGGLGSPITHDLTIADLAGSWRLDTILVVPMKLGAIAHTVANVALAKHHKVKLKGIVFNCVKPCSEENINHWAPKNLVESLTQVPVLGYFPYVEKIDNLTDLAKITADSLRI
ncbi:dethiobiotin synthase [Geminocystis sp. GBBB08]|uniref:dethiobiotin synthase n=1 Tax=Geminocystis sp. GBBB08 TaxID=2604140 RepID=UPI0027E373BB|nr:dethiobiotin synthase [Geminocystis sp. GBBB08]MBL1210422.1 ATP-dependent dethiobiotin synthetase BioD [Geminocystis sp. GBBB08]